MREREERMLMVRKLLTALAIVLVPVIGLADTITLSWDGVPEATQYAVYQSLDGALTWAKVATIRNTAISIEVPGDRLVIFRIGAQISGAETPTLDKGSWYFGRLKAP